MDQAERLETILSRLNRFSAERALAIVALLDTATPSGFRRLAELGMPIATGATTRQLLDYIAPRLRKSRMDRELRDYILLPLREVGILRTAYVDTDTGEVVPDYWKPKSPNNVYVLDTDFRELITASQWDEDTAERWLGSTPERLVHVASAEAAAVAKLGADRLVPGTIELYCPAFLGGYEVVFVDDSDGPRISDHWLRRVQTLHIPLDLATRWPDIILYSAQRNGFWIVDCVETDGEIDTVRKRELQAAFTERGLTIDGFTTAYRTIARFAQRQAQLDNIAPDTLVWIMELGGSQFLKQTTTYVRHEG